MTGLILKDFLVMKKTLRYYLLVMAVYSFMAFTGTLTYSIVSGFAVIMGCMAPMSTFAYDEQARWDKFAVSTPVGRKGVVKARYLFSLILLLVGGVLAVVISFVIVRFGKVEATVWWEPLAITAVVCLVGLLLNCVILPILFKFGAEKSRVVSLAIFGVTFGGMAALAWLVENRGLNLSGVGEAIAALPPAVLIAAPVVIVFALFYLSYLVSVGFYQKKEL